MNQTYDRQTGEISASNPLSVAVFLRAVNAQLAQNRVRVCGEISSVNHYARAIYFTLADVEEEALLSCVIFRYRYELSGLELKEGDKVIVSGVPEVYARTGRFSLKAEMLEPAGEGELKKAYEKLKARLGAEGLLSAERKRTLPQLPQRIGLITSRDGAAIGDFTANLGNYGLKILFVHSAVEGARAVPELLAAIKTLSRKKIDLLVIVRGGGSLESLQAFNNEAVVRAVAEFPVPVVAGIGHERDETLVTLAADAGVSTPTASARLVCAGYDAAAEKLRSQRYFLTSVGENMLRARIEELTVSTEKMLFLCEKVLNAARRKLQLQPRQLTAGAEKTITRIRERISAFKAVANIFQTRLILVGNRLDSARRLLRSHDPIRILSRGYAIVRKDDQVIRRTKDVSAGDKLSIQVKDGKIKTKVVE